jgi:hypothetical protein
MRFSNAQVGITRNPPMLGEHNAEVPGTLLGLSADRIAALAGAVVPARRPATLNRFAKRSALARRVAPASLLVVAAGDGDPASRYQVILIGVVNRVQVNRDLAVLEFAILGISNRNVHREVLKPASAGF